MITAAWPVLQSNLLVLDTREAILDLAPLLQNLAERCGQPGAMHWLPYFLDEAVTRRRLPYLVLLLKPEEQQGRSLCAEDLEAAALFFEYRICGLRSGAVTAADAVGFSSVIAPAGQRARVAAMAARALVERGANIVLATYEDAGEPESRSAFTGWKGVLAATRHRDVQRVLRLAPTMEATLAQMGKSTRFNFRYYRRRLQKHAGCVYVEDARPALQDADFHAINRASLNPVPEAEFARRVRSATTLQDSFLVGLRAADGRWLSLAGGWRQGKTTVLHWQSNASGFEKQSVGTVMRSFFLEAEIARGADTLLIYGGTPHSMRYAFERQTVADLVLRRKGLHASLLGWSARFFSSSNSVLGRENFLASTLRDPGLNWSSAAPALRSQTSGLLKPRHSETIA